MIIDKLDNAASYYGLGNNIMRALEIAKTLNADCECKKYVVDGDKLFYTVMEPETHEDGRFESHLKYIDVQVILSGTDAVGYEHIDRLKVTEDKSAEVDAIFYEGAGSVINVPAGSFYIAYPQDGHKPNLISGDNSKLKKAVFKVLID